MSSGSYGATSGENRPANIIREMMTKLTAPSGCWRTNSTTTVRLPRLAAEGSGDRHVPYRMRGSNTA